MTTPEPAAAVTSRPDWHMAGFYVFAFAAGGVVKPFLNLYLVEVGLTNAQIGVLQGWTALAAVAITPLIGVVADRTQRHRLLLAIIVLLKGLSAPLLLLSNAWAWLATTVGLRVITSQAQDAIMNRLTLAWLHTRQRTNLGAIRFWGAVSFAATSILAGWLARDDSVGVLFPLAGVMGVLAVGCVGAFPPRIAERPTTRALRQGLPRRSPELMFVFAIIFMFTLSFSGPDTFGFVYLGEDLDAGNDLIGMLGAVAGLAPLPAFYAADILIRRRGAAQTMAISFACFALGWTGYAVIPGPEWAAPLVMLQGFGQALYLVSMVLLLGGMGLPERAATDQMLAQLTVPGLAAITAQPASGWLYDHLGGDVLFALDAGLVLVTATVLVVGLPLVRRRTAPPHTIRSIDDNTR